MLYNSRMSNPILPESVQPGKHYSFRADLKLNAWAFVAMLVSAIARWLLQHHPEWSRPLQSAVALSPLLPSLFYVRSIGRWLGGMDELQRLIQLQACLFATTGTVLITTGLSLLEGKGIFLWRFQHGLGWEGTFAVVIFLYVVGNIIINRRYR